VKKQTLDLQKLYKLPWTTYNNPNGWIEPTTYCQLACPGCYRGLAFPNPPRLHEDIDKLKKEVDTLIKIRKIKILTIAGGEPLLYPKLNELVSYAKKRNVQTRILTNGIALTPERLTTLKNLGVTEVVIHVADYQNRPNYHKNNTDNESREKYCQMFRKIKGVQLNFIMTISKDNFHTLPKVLEFYKKNSDVISRVFFTLYRDIFFQKPKMENTKHYIPLEKMIKLIRRIYEAEPCAYLGKTLDKNSPSWLFFAPILLENETIGYADGKTVEKLHSKNQNDYWNPFPAGESTRSLFKSIALLSASSIRKTMREYVRQIIKNPKKILKTPTCQIIILLDTPTLTNNGWNLCDGCPDAVLYNNQLVPSCLLERIKLGERITL